MRQNKIITRFSILLGVLFFWGNNFAQISLSINQQTIKQIIPQIEKTSGYNVFYTDKLPNLDTRKDLLVSNAPLEATLKELFKGTKITFEIKPNKQVLLFQQANKPSGNRKQVPSKLLVEAESFDRKGGWVVDQQFMDLMGSPYLMAHGMGVPVEDASTTISFPEDGTYYVFVRTYNWTSPWYDGKGPGKFTLAVDNKKLPVVLGDEGKQWMWQPAGTVSVKAGSSSLTLKDLTGFNGRCDAIYFTTEKGQLPPAQATQLTDFRKKMLDIPAEPEQYSYDVIVTGGGIAGMCAAATASRLGCKVALINDRPVLGGNNSSEVRVHLGGNIGVGPNSGLGRMIREFGHSKEGNAKPAANYEDEKKELFIANEKNITLYANYRAISVKPDGNRIESVIIKHIENGKVWNCNICFDMCSGNSKMKTKA